MRHSRGPSIFSPIKPIPLQDTARIKAFNIIESSRVLSSCSSRMTPVNFKINPVMQNPPKKPLNKYPLRTSQFFKKKKGSSGLSSELMSPTLPKRTRKETNQTSNQDEGDIEHKLDSENEQASEEEEAARRRKLKEPNSIELDYVDFDDLDELIFTYFHPIPTTTTLNSEEHI